MKVLLSIIILIIIFRLFSRKKRPKASFIDQKKEIIEETKSNSYQFKGVEYSNYDDIKKNWYREIRVPFTCTRKTYIIGRMVGKYYGEYTTNPNHIPIYKIKIYEAYVYPTPSGQCSCLINGKETCNGIHKFFEENFVSLQSSQTFDKSQLPDEFILVHPNDHNEYKIQLNDIIFDEVTYNSQFHQTDDKEVFGTLECTITGYIADIVKDIRLEREYKYIANNDTPIFPFVSSKGNIDIGTKVSTPISEKTGNLPIYEEKGKIKSTNNEATKSTNKKAYILTSKHSTYQDDFLAWLPGIILGILLLVMIPQLLFLIPIFLIIFLLSIIPSFVWKWVINIIVGIYFISLGILFLTSIFTLLKSSQISFINIPKYTIQSNRKPTSTLKKTEITYTENSNHSTTDTIWVFTKKWKDYHDNSYEGIYTIRKKDYLLSRNYKRTLVHDNNSRNYNYVVHKIKENDQNRLNGVYQMLDSISLSQKINKTQFADMVISFVQDYDYSLILPSDCDPTAYSDEFIKSYLTSNQGSCIPNEPFGLTTPVETLTSTKTDCDSRTLLLYTILSRYKYDVILLSSDIYKHSIIGINLPYKGKDFYTYGNQKYALVETTTKGAFPGYISNEISDTKNWYISLKSK